MNLAYDPQLLLEDHSLEIPPFLQRNEDGTFRFPGLPSGGQRVGQYSSSAEDDYWADYEARARQGRDRDAGVAALLVTEIQQTNEAAKAMGDAERRIERARQKAAEKERKNKIRLKQREEQLKSFKWSWE